MSRYAEDKPSSCEYCYFWNEKQKKCRRIRCYYEISKEASIPDSEHKFGNPCKGCPYGKKPCIGFCLRKILKEQREKRYE